MKENYKSSHLLQSKPKCQPRNNKLKYYKMCLKSRTEETLKKTEKKITV